MKTIVITSQKGGSGKTTLTAHLSVKAERTGESAGLIRSSFAMPENPEFLDENYLSCTDNRRPCGHYVLTIE